MNKIEVNKIAAFTKDGKGGNFAGVVLDAEKLEKGSKQRIASEVNFSETAFVSRTYDGNISLEFFTPNRQIDICGHATVAAFSLMRDRKLITPGTYSFQSTLGEHKVEVEKNSVGLWQQAQFRKVIDPEVWKDPVANSIGINPIAIVSPLLSASNGSAFLLVELSQVADLNIIKPDFQAILDLSNRLDLVGYYIFSRADKNNFAVRMFAPRYGIPEESATGMGAGALALATYSNSQDAEIIVEQGTWMPKPSPSIMNVKIFPDGKALVSGQAKIMCTN